MLAMSAMPSIARLASAQASSQQLWSTLCGSFGQRVIALDTRTEGDDRSAGHSSATKVDCPFCATHLALSMPPVAPRVDMPARLIEGLPTRYFSAPRPSHAWASARSRAPPALI